MITAVRTLLLAVAALTVPVAGAAAAAPFSAGTAVFDNPRIAVTATGQHHVVWPSTAPGQVGYCRVAAGESGCNLSQILSLPGITGSTSFNGVDVSSWGTNQVVIHAACDFCGGGNGKVFRWSSDDDGATFSALPLQVNTSTSFLIGQGYNEQDMFYVGTGGTQIHAMPPGGAAKPIVSDIAVIQRTETDRVPGTNQLVFATSGGTGANAVKTSWFEHAAFTPLQINTQGNWNGPTPLPSATPQAREVALSAGPARLVLLHGDDTSGDLYLRTWDPATKTFGLPAAIDDVAEPVADFDAHTDASGVLRAVWANGGTLRVRATAADGLSFGPSARVATGESLVADLATAGQFAVWRGSGNAVRIVQLEALPDDPPPGGGTPPPGAPPGPTPPGGSPLGSGLPGDPGFPGTSYPATAPKQAIVSKTKQATYTFEVPRGCVRPGQRFRVTLKWKRAKRKGNVFVKVRRADFFLGNRRVKVDRKPVFAHTYRLQTSAKPGATVRLRSRAYIKVKRGKSPTKSIRATVEVCNAA